MKRLHRTTAATAAFLGLALTLAACGGDSGSGGGDGPLAGADLTVGSKEFTESEILGQIAAVALEHAGASITDQTGLSGSATVREALETGEIDLYWDYTGTGWVNILGNSTEEVPDDLYEAVKEADAANGIAWLPPANFENTYRLATSAAFAQENGLTTTSDAAAFIQANPDQGAICAASEFINRDDGLPGLEEAYGFEFTEIVELDLNLIYTQVGDSCQFGEVFSTDARIVSNDLLVLEDDKDFFIQYAGAVTLRQETLDAYPEIAEILDPISQALTNEVMTSLNGQVDNDGEQPRDVAEEWLTDEGFLG
ncbi:MULTISPECIES: glycine betaine ABC transporter substrate-binding protein [unclassified Pseudactinotalea]|uniref:ABC transporter substrate-binding protein n=1 Tax=unclassified Pseudactinotalea TaxID=2649176 RepID=UPI00128D5DB6|nr:MULTISPECIES: glycine betaine ABC transporter substrate-binding protein [unclassified Pseudactinotalea]MPV49250.1 glycine/betaine ABC transporter substrate-binding protein [Pseudactinotalea sp. HY160]QGH69452.1 glycine/betaine ABC transporter substrate-binding protein [Pseudactinotalea sp. HY158]